MESRELLVNRSNIWAKEDEDTLELWRPVKYSYHHKREKQNMWVADMDYNIHIRFYVYKGLIVFLIALCYGIEDENLV